MLHDFLIASLNILHFELEEQTLVKYFSAHITKTQIARWFISK